MYLLVSVSSFAAFARFRVLLVDNLLRFHSHVHNVGGFSLETTVCSKSAKVATQDRAGSRSVAAALRQSDRTNRGRPPSDYASHAKRWCEVYEKWCLPFSGDLSSSMRPKCISLIELGEVGRGSHSGCENVSQATYIKIVCTWELSLRPSRSDVYQGK